MKTLYLSILATSIIVFASISPIWATSDLSVNLSASGAPSQATFKFSESAFIEYSNGGKLKDLLTGKNYTINFTENSDNTSVQDLIHQLNTALVSDQKSPVIITDLTIRYTTTLVGDAKSASIDCNLELIPTLTSYVLKKGANDNDPTIIDAAWMGVTLKGPVIIMTSGYGDVEINKPISLIQKVAPDVYSIIKGTSAEIALQNNLIDASDILQDPLDHWPHLYDPSYVLSETNSLGYKGQKVAVTTYATEGTAPATGDLPQLQNTTDFVADVNYRLMTIQHPNSVLINIGGLAFTTSVGGTPAFGTRQQATTGPDVIWWDSAYPTVLVIIGGAAVIIFWVIFFRRFRD